MHTVAHGGPVTAVAWSPSGTQLATGCDDRQLRIVDAASGAFVHTVGHGGPVHAVAWNP